MNQQFDAESFIATHDAAITATRRMLGTNFDVPAQRINPPLVDTALLAAQLADNPRFLRDIGLKTANDDHAATSAAPEVKA